MKNYKERGKSVQIVENLQSEERVWVPITPAKPQMPHFRSPYGVEELAMEQFLSRSTQNPQPFLSPASLGSACSSNNHHPLGANIGGNIDLQQLENNGYHVEEHLPSWNSQGGRTQFAYTSSPQLGPKSDFPFLRQWEASRSVRKNNVDAIGGEDLFSQSTSFTDLLAMNDSGIGNTAFYQGWNAVHSVNDTSFNGRCMFTNQIDLQRINQHFRDIFGEEMQDCGSLHQYQSLCSGNSSHTNTNAKISMFAPATPDLLWRTDSMGSENTPIDACKQASIEQNEDREQDIATAKINLQNVIDAAPNADVSSPDKVSTAVEFHDPEKGCDQVIDLNKTPQKKPRRRRYLPKVLSEKKPRKTPKPKTPKPVEVKETTKVKKKYVRKKKVDTNTTPAQSEAGESKPTEVNEAGDTKPDEIAAKSCRKSLKFDLNGQEAESNLPPMSNGDAYVEVQGKCHIERNQHNHTSNDSQGVDLVVEAARGGIAYDLNWVLNQELEEYLSLPTKDYLDNSKPDQDILSERRESTPHTLSGNNAEILSRSDIPLLAESPNSSPSASLSEQKHKVGSKRHNPYIGDMDGVSPTHCTLQKLNHAFSNNTNIGEHQNSPIPVTSKKKRTEKVQRPQEPSTSSCVPLGDVNLVDTSSHPRVDPSASKCYCCNPSPFGIDPTVNINHNNVLMEGKHNTIELTNSWADLARLKKKLSQGATTRVHDLAQLIGITSFKHAKPGPKGPRKKKIDMSGDANIEGGITSFPHAKPGPKGPRKKKIDISEDANTEVGITSLPHAKPGPKGPRKKKIDIPGDAITEALAASSTANPRSKKRAKKQKSENKQLDPALYNCNQSIKIATGSFPVLTWTRSISSVEEITMWMKELDISKESCRTETDERIQEELLQEPKNALKEQNALVLYRANEQEQNALVIYGRDGTMVPFEGPFDPVRKRRQRAKVDLDDETAKVWNLLLENINNEGINGTDEDKTKWWENERSIFRGRVDSFIARMRLVQGDRRFTRWKGSVLDSVIGVFLTQNVADHLSSSAFMSMAAHFPLKSEGSEITLSGESATALVEEPDICVIEPEESISWNEKTINQQILTTNSRIIHDVDYSEEKEVVNSELTRRVPGSVSPKDYSSESSQKNPSSTVSNANSQTTENETASVLGDDRAKDDATSSQHSVMSSQNSTNTPNLHTVEMMNFFSENDSRTQPLTTSCQSNYLDGSTSFLELLKMAESPLHEFYNRTQHDLLDCMNHATKNFPDAQGTGSSNYRLNLSYQFSNTKGFEILQVDNKSLNTSRKDENSTPAEQSNLTTESTVHLTQETSSDNIPRSFTENMSCYVLEREKSIHLPSVKEPSASIASSLYEQTSSAWKSTNPSQVNADVTESTTVFKRTSNDQKEVGQVPAQTYASTSKSQKGKAGTKKTETIDWDRLRREAQPNGQKKVRTANTRDSLDWEAVRHADVSEIAEVIKERGMNNKLAERIKALLDRLVKDHGSVDMEWLRDIPPDKAKEYLLSFRGLGLKSVECVRLLTLHHLAFPVDTNVGRIAVRLGWVPLQPLPESLQLHLLELYPILESIQKYLWPRLCKLDQKTLYELHYHLITFGKVFCTKKQPNCNACPLRAECRHFASAFASARFALPATEEKSILPSNASISTHASSQAGSYLLPLPPALSNQQSQNSPRSIISLPTIEDSPSALVLPLPQTISHLERPSETTNCEPIVEVPASPEPDQEQTICDIEDAFYEDPDEIPTITLSMKELSKTIQNYTQSGESNALVALPPEAASIPTPKLKNINRLRTEHHVYELPDSHPLLKGLDKREADDPSSYLLAIWTPGETADSIQPPERRCNAENPSMMCNEVTCSYCNSLREANSQIVRGTLLIPCRTATRGSFPLNGTYFQVNEVFADHDSSLSPIAVPRSWLWNLPRRTVYFGTSIHSIFKGLTTEDIQHCFWRGFVCVRGFDQKTRAPRPLMARLHFPASRMQRGAKGKPYDE